MAIYRDQPREAEAARREPPRYEAEELREWREEAVRRARRRARPRRAPETRSGGGSWVCTACTYENLNPNALVCEICNTVSLALRRRSAPDHG